MLYRATQFACKKWAVPIEDLKLSIQPINGGLESRVLRVTFLSPPAKGACPGSFMMKELRGLQRRETGIYRELWNRSTQPPAVRVLGTEVTDDADYLYLEEVTQESIWPWNQTASSAAVCRALAQLHEGKDSQPQSFRDWNYESDLALSAEETLKVALEARDSRGMRHWRRMGDLRRVVAALPQLRLELLKEPTFIHGDVHSGNVIVRPGDTGESIVFIDWARARLGSPLEDVASWLHSLGCWEPEARRRHDTLLRTYLEARSLKANLTAELRKLYWYASASNGLSGAIRYHLVMLADAGSSEMRSNSARSLHAWERVIRRVAALLSTSRTR